VLSLTLGMSLPDAGLSSACLDACPAEDDLDFACAVHDFCYGQSDPYEDLFSNFTCTSRTTITS
jgi:hypothetical protein